jgi:hypothetical protein
VIVRPIECPVTLPGLKKQTLSWAVIDEGKVLAVFATENSATAYRMRLDALKKRMAG